MKNIHLFLPLLLLLAISLQAAKPNHKKIKRWLGQSRFSITKMDKVYLLDNERAFLTHIVFDNEDAIIKKALVLVRPDLEEAEFISSFSFDYEIIDLNHDGVSEIIFSNEVQEDKYKLTTRSIIQLHDYKVVSLYTRSFKEQTRCSLCLKESLSWKIKDLNKDKIKDIKEHYTLSLSNQDKTIILQDNKKELLFQEGKFSFTKKQRNLMQMLVSHDVKSRQAVQVTQSFTFSDPQVACFLDFTQVKRKEKVIYYWINKDLQKVLRREQTIHPASRYRTWMFKSIKNKDSYLGNWIIVLLNEDKSLLDSQEFIIEKAFISKDANLSQIDLNLTETMHLSELTVP
ncbi:MAG: hypothetical protein COA44_10165 [Arcobacter sp.]|nr:MAG: hypothetical protein COA44_10165 [Arcobacter sp.]